MTARWHWQDGAGEWVAFRDEPRRSWMPPGPNLRMYLWDKATLTTSPSDCVRFDTKAEAMAAARARWPRRVQGCRIGAERIKKETTDA